FYFLLLLSPSLLKRNGKNGNLQVVMKTSKFGYVLFVNTGIKPFQKVSLKIIIINLLPSIMGLPKTKRIFSRNTAKHFIQKKRANQSSSIPKGITFIF